MTPLVRLAAIVWLIFTSEAAKKLQGINEEQPYLTDLICLWWGKLQVLRNVLPLAESLAISEFERRMFENGHSCFVDFYVANGRKSIAAWLYVQSVLFPDRAGAPVSLMCHRRGLIIYEVCQN